MSHNHLSPISSQSPTPKIELLLSGGGYRATVFHIGVLRFLYEHKIAASHSSMLELLNLIVGTSGGSITAAHFAIHANEYLANFHAAAQPLLALVRNKDCRRLILRDHHSLSDILRDEFGAMTFSGLPDTPELCILGTSLKSGNHVAFTKSAIRVVGKTRYVTRTTPAETKTAEGHNLPVRTAVAASAAFPPFIPPVRFTPEIFAGNPKLESIENILGDEIADGGIRDNLGIDYHANLYPCETDRWCIVSDAGFAFDLSLKETSTQSLKSWLDRLQRVTDIQMDRIRDGDLQRIPNAIHLSMDDCGGAPSDENTKVPEYEQPLTRTLAREASLTSTDLTPLSESQIYALLRLGYDVADRKLKGRFELVKRDKLVDDNFWQLLWPPTCRMLEGSEAAKPSSSTRTTSLLQDILIHLRTPRVTNAADAITQLPLSAFLRRLLLCFAVFAGMSKAARNRAAIFISILFIFLLAGALTLIWTQHGAATGERLANYRARITNPAASAKLVEAIADTQIHGKNRFDCVFSDYHYSWIVAKGTVISLVDYNLSDCHLRSPFVTRTGATTDGYYVTIYFRQTHQDKSLVYCVKPYKPDSGANVRIVKVTFYLEKVKNGNPLVMTINKGRRTERFSFETWIRTDRLAYPDPCLHRMDVAWWPSDAERDVTMVPLDCPQVNISNGKTQELLSEVSAAMGDDVVLASVTSKVQEEGAIQQIDPKAVALILSVATDLTSITNDAASGKFTGFSSTSISTRDKGLVMLYYLNKDETP